MNKLPSYNEIEFTELDSTTTRCKVDFATREFLAADTAAACAKICRASYRELIDKKWNLGETIGDVYFIPKATEFEAYQRAFPFLAIAYRDSEYETLILLYANSFENGFLGTLATSVDVHTAARTQMVALGGSRDDRMQDVDYVETLIAALDGRVADIVVSGSAVICETSGYGLPPKSPVSTLEYWDDKDRHDQDDLASDPKGDPLYDMLKREIYDQRRAEGVAKQASIQHA